MKLFFNVLKVLAALAVIAGIVYVAIKYGDKIVAVHWKHDEIFKDHPAICFWQGSDRAVLIAEGLTDEKLEGFVKQANNL